MFADVLPGRPGLLTPSSCNCPVHEVEVSLELLSGPNWMPILCFPAVLLTRFMHFTWRHKLEVHLTFVLEVEGLLELLSESNWACLRGLPSHARDVPDCL